MAAFLISLQEQVPSQEHSYWETSTGPLLPQEGRHQETLGWQQGLGFATCQDCPCSCSDTPSSSTLRSLGCTCLGAPVLLTLDFRHRNHMVSKKNTLKKNVPQSAITQ